jgi:hypothetical protein
LNAQRTITIHFSAAEVLAALKLLYRDMVVVQAIPSTAHVNGGKPVTVSYQTDLSTGRLSE